MEATIVCLKEEDDYNFGDALNTHGCWWEFKNLCGLEKIPYFQSQPCQTSECKVRWVIFGIIIAISIGFCV
jgi:hypothetical protein